MPRGIYKHKNLTKESGVYGIFLEGINMVYIGSCKQFNRRWTEHLTTHKRNEYHKTRAELLFTKGEELGIEPYMKILEVNDDKEVYESREYELMQEYANNGWYVVNYKGMQGGRQDYYNKDARREYNAKYRAKHHEDITKYNAKIYAKEMQERIDKRLAEGKPLTNKQKEFLNTT